MYLFIAYKSDGANYCRGCVMEQWGSDFHCSNQLNAEQLTKSIAEYLYLNKTEDGTHDFHIFEDGIKVYDSDYGGYTWDGMDRCRHEYNSAEYFEFEEINDKDRAAAHGRLTEIMAAAEKQVTLKIQQIKEAKEKADFDAKIRRDAKEKADRKQQFDQLRQEFEQTG